jgi:hypothetical protein
MPNSDCKESLESSGYFGRLTGKPETDSRPAALFVAEGADGANTGGSGGREQGEAEIVP